jgi:hypothetical protein
MLQAITIKERGATPRKLRKAYNQAGKESWLQTAAEFHSNYRDKRFTVAHGRAAGYQPRAGENLPFGSKAFWRSYYGRKIRQKGTRAPLVWSGKTRDATRLGFRLSSTRNVGRVAYASARVFNYRPFMAEEFRRITREEAGELAKFFDEQLSQRLGAFSEASTTKV